MHNKKRLARPPENYQKIGFGLSPIPDHYWEYRRDAVKRVQEIYQDPTPVWTPEVFQSLVCVRDMFRKVSCENSNHWFTISRLLGLPSGRLAGRTEQMLRSATEALRLGEIVEFDRVLNLLDRQAFGDMLDAYLGATDPIAPRSHEEPCGWVALAWSSARRDELLIRTSTGKVSSLLPEPVDGQPYGLLAAWNVTDPHLAQAELGGMFHDLLKWEPVRLYTNIDHLIRIKLQVEAMLKRENIMLLSPWHRIERQRKKRPVSVEATPSDGTDDHALPPEIAAAFAAFGRR